MKGKHKRFIICREYTDNEYINEVLCRHKSTGYCDMQDNDPVVVKAHQ